MKIEHDLHVLGYVDNWEGRADDPEPLVHLMYTGDATVQQSIGLPPAAARRLAATLLQAARDIEAGKDFEFRFGWETNE